MRRADTPTEAWPPVVGGYTLTEVLSVGERANVFAALAAREPSQSFAARSVVVKVRLGGQGTSVRHARFSTASHLGELEVLSARPIAAMPRLIAVVGDEEGRPALVLARCEGRQLGEVATAGDCDDSAVRAIAVEVRRLHEAGWAHGGLDPGSVLVGAGGGVTLVGFGRAVARGAPGFDEAAAGDIAWVSRLERAARQTAGTHEDIARHGQQFSPERGLDRGVGEGWAWPNERVLVAADAGAAPRIAETVDPALVAVSELLRAVRAAPVGWARRLPRSTLAKAGLAAVLTAVVVTAVVVLLPSGERAGGVGAEPGAVEGGREGNSGVDGGVARNGGVEGGERGAGDGGAEGDGVPDDGGPAGGGASTTGADPAVIGDDPVAATAALLRVRAKCFAAEDAACLDEVDQWGSPALVADLEEMQADSGGRRTLAAASGVEVLHLVQRVGDFAIVEVKEAEAGEEAAGENERKTAAAPLLVVRGGAGWRLRSYGQVGP